MYGLGSTHTPYGYVWPLAFMIEGLTTSNSTRVAELFTWLLRMQCGNGLMHESVFLTDQVLALSCVPRARSC
jgi:meiotically up-regulated gene 157 (Mug157) protein